MNPLTHLKKGRILALMIAPALIVGAAFIPVPAHATPSCGVVSINILDPVTAGFFPDDSLDLRCKTWILIGTSKQR
jgi:hypothetical protein